MEAKTIPLHLHPLGFIEAFTHFGADLDRLLENTGISRSMLSSRRHRISYRQQHQLIRNGIRLCRKPGLGLLVGQFMDWSYNGSVGAVVHCSPSLKDAGEAFRRYILIAQPYYAMYVHRPNVYVDQQGLVVTPLRWLASPSNDQELNLFEIEYRLAVTLRVADLCGNKSVANPAVHTRLHYPEPAHSEMYRDLPCESVSFDCDQTTLSSHHEFLTTPWRELRRATFERIIEQCEEEFQAADLEISATRQVHWHLSSFFSAAPGRQITLEEVAEVLATTPRALTRKLAGEGSSFRSILHQVRMEVASHHLQSSTLSVERIAELMGFSNPSSLRRAIKNWSGQAVGKLREAGSENA